MFKLLRRLILLVLLLVVAGVGVILYADSIAETAIEKGGTYALGVDTTVDSVSIGIFSGELGLSELKVANPDGFNGPALLSMADGDVAVSLPTLTKDKIVIPRIILSGLKLSLEKRGDRSNYGVILENLKRLGAGSPESKKEDGKRFVIEELALRDISVSADVLNTGGIIPPVTLQIPEIRLLNVGSESDQGLLLEEVSGVLMTALFGAVSERGAGILPNLIAGELQKGLSNIGGFDQFGIGVVDNLGKHIGTRIFGDGTTLPDATKKALEGAAGEALKGLGGLLGGDEKKK